MPPPSSRPNLETARIVEEGILMHLRCDRYQAADFMTMHGVGFRVIVRALDPGARRRAHTPRPADRYHVVQTSA